MEENKRIERDIADTIIDRPQGFQIGRRHFYLYPVSLGKAYLTQRVMKLLDIDKENIKLQPTLEALRVVRDHRDDVALLLAYFTLQTKQELLSKRKVTINKNYLAKELDDSDMATLLISAVTMDKTNEIMQYLEIDKEQERMHEVMEAKDTKNTFSFGAKTIYGSLIDTACERYGWTYDYVVWGISYTNLRLLLADRNTSIFLSEEEAKRVHIINPSRTIDGNDKEAVMKAIKGRSWN